MSMKVTRSGASTKTMRYSRERREAERWRRGILVDQQHHVVGVPHHHEGSAHTSKAEVARGTSGQTGRRPDHRYALILRRDAGARGVVDHDHLGILVLGDDTGQRLVEEGARVAIPHGHDHGNRGGALHRQRV